MPTYDYLCRDCGETFEIFQSMSEGPKRKCPSCGRLKLERLIGTGAGIIFKGTGFYQTDYRSESYKKAEKAERAAREGISKSDGSKKSKAAEKDRKPGSKSAEKPKAGTGDAAA